MTRDAGSHRLRRPSSVFARPTTHDPRRTALRAPPALPRQLIGKRLAKLERVLNDSAVSATVILSKEKYRHIAEIVVHAKGDHTLSGIGSGNAWPRTVRPWRCRTSR